MATILALQHSARCTPGRLGATLRDHGFRLDVRRVDLPHDRGGSPVPADLDNVHAVLALGGPQNVGDPHPWLEPEMHLLAQAVERGIPVVGVCLGHQILAAALGGEVGPMDTPEAGFHPVELTFEGRNDTILGGVAWKSWQFQSHGHEVKKLPEGAALLASSPACKVQVFRVGHRAYGFQYHFECDRDMAEAYPPGDHDLWTRAGVNTDQLRAQLDDHYEMFARLADRVSVNLATLAFSFDRLTAV